MNKQQDLLEKLHELYSDSSKHAVYQNIPEFVQRGLNYTETIDERWRGDTARWNYLQDSLNFDKQSVLDIGANTGFFTLSLASHYPGSTFTALEGNSNHAEFIRMVKAHFDMPNVSILTRYLDIAGLDSLDEYDTILLFNVLHHAGVDFDQHRVNNKHQLYDYLVAYMKKLGEHAKRVVLQMGYNWGGNKMEPVVELQNDAGKYVYTSRFLRQSGWHIEAIPAPESNEGSVPVRHRNMPDTVVEAANTDDTAGLHQELSGLISADVETFSEFYRRPLFICTRKHTGSKK